MSYHKQEICFSQPSEIPGLQISIQRTNLSKIAKPNSRSTLLIILKKLMPLEQNVAILNSYNGPIKK